MIKMDSDIFDLIKKANETTLKNMVMKLVLKEQYSFPGGAIKETVLFVTCLLKR